MHILATTALFELYHIYVHYKLWQNDWKSFILPPVEQAMEFQINILLPEYIPESCLANGRIVRTVRTSLVTITPKYIALCTNCKIYPFIVIVGV